MPPRPALNERFRAYERRAWLLHTAGRVLLAVCLLAGAGFALERSAPQERFASVHANLAAVAASAPNLFERAASSVYRAICPLVGCNIAGTQSENHATSFPNVKSPDSSPIAPRGAMTATPVAVSSESPYSPPTAEQATSPQTTVVKQYITQPVIERVIQSPPMTQTSGRVLGASAENGSPQNFATVQQLADLQNQINALANLPRSVFVPSFSGPAATTPVSTAAFALSQKIDQLSGTSLSDITVNGVSGLTDADIPDGLTASNYLPLSAGTLEGDLTLTGNFTVSGAQTLSGAITIPYLTATSTTQASGFQQFTATHGTTTSLFVNSLLSSPSATIGALTATSTLAVSGTLSLPAIPWALLATDATGQVVATSSPTAAYFTTTSTTATSTFAGGITGPNNFTVQSSSGNVGIGTASPSGKLEVKGGTGTADFGNIDGLTLSTTNTTYTTKNSWARASMDFISHKMPSFLPEFGRRMMRPSVPLES